MLCRIDVRCTLYSHWLSAISGTRRRCYCSYGSAQDMKHCCWVGLLLGCYSTAWPLSPNYSRRRQCCVTVWLTGRHFITNTELTELRPDHRSAAACAISMESNQVAYRCHIAHLNPVYVWKTATRLAIWQEALLLRTDRATRCVSRNAVNCCTTVGTSCTTNQSSGFRASHRRTCNKLCVSRHGTSTVDEFGWSSCHGEIFWSRIWDKILEVNISLFLEVPEFLYNAV